MENILGLYLQRITVNSDVGCCHAFLKGRALLWIVAQADYISCLKNVGDDGADRSKASGGKGWHQAFYLKVGQTENISKYCMWQELWTWLEIGENLLNFQDSLTANYQYFFSLQNSFCIYILNSNSGLAKEIIFTDSDFLQYLISQCLCVLNRQTHGVTVLQALQLLPTK